MAYRVGLSIVLLSQIRHIVIVNGGTVGINLTCHKRRNHMTNRKLETTTIDRVSKAVASSILADKHGTAAIDALVADGFDKPSDFVSPKSQGSTVSVEEFNAINEAIVLGFGADIQRLLAKPVKSLTDAQKTTRRYWQQQIGAKRNDFKRGMQRRIDAASPDGGASRTRTIDEWFRDMANDGIKKCRAAEEAPFDIADMIKACEAVLKLAKR
jgi:hypothetical protein